MENYTIYQILKYIQSIVTGLDTKKEKKIH